MERGVDPNSDWYSRENKGLTPLIWACSNNHPITAKYLLQWGARVDTRDEGNWIALHHACYFNNIDCVKVLLAHNSPTGEPDTVQKILVAFQQFC